MFKLSLQDIHLGALPKDKVEAIHEIASALVKANYVEEGYVDGMLSREQQASTYLGNGIAIPHGTLETRDLVKQTGVQVFQFPQGVVWGDEEQHAYVAIGIAARSDEHLTLLRQLTHVLSQDGIQEKLAAAATAEELRSVLMGEDNADFLFDNSLISLNVPTDNLVTLQALNAGLLQKAAAVDTRFISGVMSQPPVHLGQGIWLNDSQHGNLINAVAVSRPVVPICKQQQPQAELLITVSVVNDAIEPVLKNLADLLSDRRGDELLKADEAELISLLNQSKISGDESGISAEFTVINAHGLHTRPASLLVKTLKDFNSPVTVANLNGTGKPVNASSLMKLVSIGAKKGDKLRFTAGGSDAQQVLDAIGKAMAEGLGEGTE